MENLRYTLLADGPSDIRLTPLLSWLLRQHFPHCAINADWADLTRLPFKPQSLVEKIHWSLELFPCDLLFIHRDAENEPIEKRIEEIGAAKARVTEHDHVPFVCVVPVRMQEAWLLFDEAALRRAANNPNGRDNLSIPAVRRVEHLPDPKAKLHALLQEASGLTGRRRGRVPAARYAYRVAETIEDFSPLRVLPAFQRLESELLAVIKSQGWND